MGLKFRRGTTAQKSGSLAFGEPYVNTDLGTLQIGGASGDITLGASGTGSAGSFSGISGSSIDITGNAKIDGNLILGGAITIGDNSSDTVNVVASLSSSLIPSETNTFDLGSINYFWRDLYISTGSIKMVSNGVVVSTLSNTGNGMIMDQGLTAKGDSSFGTSSAAVTAVTGSLKVSGSISLIGALSASTITGIGNVSLYSTSVDSRLVAAESFSSSLDSTFATDASVTIVSASAWGAFQSASAYSGSIYQTDATQSVNIATATAAAAGAFASASAYSGSFATSISASKAEYTSFSASNASTDNTQTTNITTAQNSADGAFASASAYSASAAVIDNGQDVLIASLRTNILSASVYTTFSTSVDSRITTETGRVDAILSASSADKDSFAEIVTLINSVDTTNDQSFAAFYTASNGRLNSLESATGSYAISSSVASATATSISTLSSSVKAVTDTFATSASVASATATSISTLSGSVFLVDATQTTNITQASASAWGAFQSASAYSSSLQTSISASKAEYTSFSASNASTDNTQTTNITAASASAWGAFQSASAYSASAATDVSASNAARVALSASIAASGFAVSSSVASATATSITALSSSVKAVTDTFATSASVASATATSITSLSSSVKAVTDTFATSASVASATAASITSLSSSVAAEQYAKLNVANTFTGTQTVTGSVYVSGNLVVQGSSSLQNITASVVSIGTNTVILNTDNPAVRFGGISVIDSGSSASTGSLFWDSTNNVWLYQNPDGAGYASAKLISGPKNSGSLGNEIGLTVGKVPVAVGDDHIGDSIISASATKVTVEGALDVTGNISSSTITGIGNVTLHSASVASRLVIVEAVSASVKAVTDTFATSASVASATATSISTLSGSVKAVTDTFATSASVASATATSITTLSSSVAASGFAVSSSVASATATSISTLSGSVKAVTDTFATSASVASATATSITSLSSSVKAVTDTFATSASVASATATSISTISGSVKTVTDAISGRVTTLEGKDISITLTGDVTGTGTITDLGNVSFATTIAADSVALGTDTTGNYVATMTAGAGITVGTATGEGSTPVITNTGVTSITGTANQVVASASTGGVTLSLPQSIATTSAVAFASVSATGDIVAYSGSDKRLKNNIINISDAVTKVRKLNGVTWKWNDDVNEVTKTAPTTGLIAQEVQEVLPEVVNEREDGYLGIDYSKMVGLLVEAIKEQQNQIDSLTIEIENLKKNNSL